MPRRKRRRRSSAGWAPSTRRPVRRPRARQGGPPGLLGEVRALLASGRPLDLIAHVSGLLAALDPRGDNPFESRGRRSRDEPSRDDLVRAFMAIPGHETAALLAAIRGLIADEPVRQEIAVELAARDEPLPAWLARLDEAEAYQAVETVHVLGDGENVIVGVRLTGGAELTAIVYVDHNLGTVAKDGFILDEPLEETLRLLEGASDRDTRLAEIPLADARARITEAVDHGAHTFPPFESDTWPMARPAIEWIARLLPAGGAGFARPEWSDEAVAELADRFFASPYGRPLDAEDARGLLDSILWFGTDYGPGDPLRWSPVAIEILLLDWIPRKIVADAAYLAGVPRLLRAFVAFCNAERDIPARLGRATLAALDRLAPEYQRAIRTPRLQGPAAVLAAVGALDPDDTDRLTGDVADALASVDEIMLDSLRRAVGGEEALARLDDSPLPDEPFDWAGVAEDIHEKVGEILALCDRCCDALLGPECRTACRRLLARAARGDPEVFRRPARSDTAAAALVWAVGRANDCFGSATGRRAGEVSEHFRIRGSPTQRARTLLRAAGIEDATPYDLSLGSPELLIAKRRRAIIERRDRYSAAGAHRLGPGLPAGAGGGSADPAGGSGDRHR